MHYQLFSISSIFEAVFEFRFNDSVLLESFIYMIIKYKIKIKVLRIISITQINEAVNINVVINLLIYLMLIGWICKSLV